MASGRLAGPLRQPARDDGLFPRLLPSELPGTIASCARPARTYAAPMASVRDAELTGWDGNSRYGGSSTLTRLLPGSNEFRCEAPTRTTTGCGFIPWRS